MAWSVPLLPLMLTMLLLASVRAAVPAPVATEPQAWVSSTAPEANDGLPSFQGILRRHFGFRVMPDFGSGSARLVSLNHARTTFTLQPGALACTDEPAQLVLIQTQLQS